ncbi:MAG: hypothetical protein ACOH10_10365 [Rhodoglobus sp.]
MSNPIAGPDEVSAVLGRAFVGDEEERATTLCDAVLATLELHLNRWLWERAVLGERRRTGQLGRAVLNYGPVQWVDAIHHDSPTSPSVAFDPKADWEEPLTFAPRSMIWVDYTAGHDFPNVPWAAAAIEVVATAAARVIAAPKQVAAGVLSSYSVEGTSITYGSALTGGVGTKGRLSVGDLGALARLRVPVVL